MFDKYDGDAVTRATTRFSLAKALDRARGDAAEIKALFATAERELAAASPRGVKPLAELRSFRSRK